MMHVWKHILCTVVLLTLAERAAALVPDSVQAMIHSGDSCRSEHYFNKALAYYERAYSAPCVDKNTELRFQLLVRIMRTHDVLRRWKELSETTFKLYNQALERHDTAHVSMALFARGKWMHHQGQRTQGIQYALEALDLMKQCSYPRKNYELAHFYALLAKMYLREDRYDEAMRFSKEHERYLRLDAGGQSEQVTQRAMRRLYAIRLSLYARMGRMADADSLYRLCGGKPFNDPITDDILQVYYRQRQLNDDALRFVQSTKELIRQDGDSMGRNMQRLLDDEGDIYYRMGQYREAAECFIGVTKIADTLSVRSLRNLSDEVQKVVASERDIARHNLVLAIVIAVVLLLVVVVVLLLIHVRVVRSKTHAMTATIHELMLYRDTVLRNGDPVEMGENDTDVAYEEDLRRFKEADKRIIREKLFLQPDFGRDELMRLMGVDKNTLPGIVQRFAGTNVAGYVNAKRMEYAVALMRQHPEYTLQAICEACGIKSAATFIRNFKNAYGITPSEFRKDMETGMLRTN
jgi:AraC-like DNA-binding protein